MSDELSKSALDTVETMLKGRYQIYRARWIETQWVVNNHSGGMIFGPDTFNELLTKGIIEPCEPPEGAAPDLLEWYQLTEKGREL